MAGFFILTTIRVFDKSTLVGLFVPYGSLAKVVNRTVVGAVLQGRDVVQKVEFTVSRYGKGLRISERFELDTGSG
jgi:hypothetical protein